MSAAMPSLLCAPFAAIAMRADADRGKGRDAPAEVTPPPAAAGEAHLQRWIAGIMRHDQAAFGALYQAAIGRVYGLALRITRNAALAEEVAEDTFWQVWREAPRYDAARGSAMAWVLTIARSRALDSLRARDPAELTEDADALRALYDAPDASPLDLLSATQTDHALHHALARLDAQPRQLIALAFFKGLTHDEIAAHTGLPLGTVKSHIRRGLTSLKTLLGDAASRRPE